MPLKRLTIPWDRLNDAGYKGGQKVANDLASQAKGVACDLYRNTPGALVPNPASNFLAGLWDGICSDDPLGLPPPPTPPFEGGQCCGTTYTVTYRRSWDRCGTSSFSQQLTKSMGNPGTVEKVEYRREAGIGYVDIVGYDCSGTKRVLNVFTSDNIVTSCGETPLGTGTPIPWDTVKVVILSVSPNDTATCGNPNPEFPPPPPTYTPPSGDIVIQPRPDNPDFNFNIPFVWVDADLDIDIRPYIDVGGLNISFDFGGVNIDFDTDNPPPTYDPDTNPLPDTIFPPTPLPPPGLPDIKVDIDNINNNITDINVDLDNKPDKVDIPDYQDELDRIEAKIDNLPPPSPGLSPCSVAELSFVRVVADISSYRGKTVFTDEINEVVVFGGYIRFLIDGEPYGEEIPIRRLVSNFPLPQWANGYRLIPQNGVVLTGAIVTKELPLPVVTLLDCSGGTV